MRYLLLRLKRFCGFITGVIFFIGGVLKLIDPVGAGLVMKEYFDFLHIGFMGFAAKPAGVLFAALEVVTGTGLITGIWRKQIGIAAMILQGGFTLLTLFLVIFNPQMDCGCFGEAIHLSHTETFVKNLVLCVLLAAYYFPSKLLGHNKKHKYVSFAIVTISVLVLSVYSWLYIPLVDFTASKPAAALKSGHAFATETVERYESVFVYEKNGKEETFDLENLPDSTWNFVRTETKEREGYKDKDLLDLSFTDADGIYLDEMAVKGKVMIVSVYDIDSRSADWNATARFVKDAQSNGFKPIILVAGTPEQMSIIADRLDNESYSTLKDHVFYSDYKALITLNRSNMGVTYFSDGYLIRKWAGRNMPDHEALKETATGDDTETIIGQSTNGSLTFQGFLLYVFAVMLLL